MPLKKERAACDTDREPGMELEDAAMPTSEANKRQALSAGVGLSWRAALSALASGEGDLLLDSTLDSAGAESENRAAMVHGSGALPGVERELQVLLERGQELAIELADTRSRLDDRLEAAVSSLQSRFLGLTSDLTILQHVCEEKDGTILQKDAVIASLRADLAIKDQEVQYWRGQAVAQPTAARPLCEPNDMARLSQFADSIAADLQATAAQFESLQTSIHTKIDVVLSSRAARTNAGTQNEDTTALAYMLQANHRARATAQDLLTDVGVGLLVLDSSVRDITAMCEHLHDRDALVEELQVALLERQKAKSALQLEVESLQAQVATCAEQEASREKHMSSTLESLQKATAKIYVLDQAKDDMQREVTRH